MKKPQNSKNGLPLKVVVVPNKPSTPEKSSASDQQFEKYTSEIYDGLKVYASNQS